MAQSSNGDAKSPALSNLTKVSIDKKRLPRIAQWPWSRRASIFDPPTLLDGFLISPLRVLVQYIYSVLLFLRGPSFRPPQNKPPIRIVCISDTHTNTPDVPPGDLLIHAGDLTNTGTVKEIQTQLDWLNSLPHRHKVFVAGNHDSYFDPKSRKSIDKTSGANLSYGSLHYLRNQSLQLKFKGGRTLNIYGSPDIPQCGGTDFAFQYPRHLPPWENRIPTSTDILITHSPPRCHLDNNQGCAGLLDEIWRFKPRLHVFGHIHAAHGREAVFWDNGQAAYERVMARQKAGVLTDCIPSGAWLDMLKVVWYGVKGIIWQHLMVGPKGSNGGLLVNAALAHWSSADIIGSPPEIVDL